MWQKLFMKLLQQGLEEFLGALFHTCVCFFLPSLGTYYISLNI